MAHEFRASNKIDNFMRGERCFARELVRQKDRRLRNPKIGWPFFGFIYTTQERRVLLRREVGVEFGAKLLIHW